MDIIEIIKYRLVNQLLEETKFKTIKDTVNWMGAIQAQDYAMSEWAVGIRTLDSTQNSVEEAINKGEIFRTHVLRPTWHLISSEDIFWMLELTAPRIKAAMKSRDSGLGLTEDIHKKCYKILTKALEGNKSLSRDILLKIFDEANIQTNENRLYHILQHAEIDGIICSGVSYDNKQTYALLSERAPDKKTLTKDEALAKLASKYFQSHSPATLQDFIWWSGLTAKDAANAVEMIKCNFISEVINSQTFLLTNSFSIPKRNPYSAFLLPAYDEFIISYKSRTFLFPSGQPVHYIKAISNNGVFRPTVFINGQIAGLWKRTIKKDNLYAEVNFFRPLEKEIEKIIAVKIEEFGNFLGISNNHIVIKYGLL